MRTFRPVLAWTLATFALGVLGGPTTLAEAELVLADGQVLRGAELERKKDTYYLTLESGDVLTLPVTLVRQVRLAGSDPPSPALKPTDPQVLAGIEDPTDDEIERKRRGPTGMEKSDPRTLAGDEKQPPTPREQLEVLGEPSEFRDGPVDPTFVPESGLSDRDVLADSRSRFRDAIVDPEWKPVSAYDPDVDVLAAGRSEFYNSPVDPNWSPSDGFFRFREQLEGRLADLLAQPAPRRAREARPLEIEEIRAAVSEADRLGRDSVWDNVLRDCDYCDDRPADVSRIPAARVATREERPTPQTCAEELLSELPAREDHLVRVRPFDEPRLVILPIDLYLASLDGVPDSPRAVFTLAGDVCRMVTGDLDRLLDIDLGSDQAIALAENALSAALRAAGPTPFPDDAARIDYALAVVTLIDPTIALEDSRSPEIVASTERLDELTQERGERCEVAGRIRRREGRLARAGYRPPSIVVGATGDVVSFYTWRETGGILQRYSLYLASDGSVSITRQTVARHVGDHGHAPTPGEVR